MRSADGSVTRRVRGVKDLRKSHFDSMAVAPHPSMAVRLEAYEKVGLFNEELKFSMDFEWLARCLQAGFDGVYSESLVAVMAEGGASNRHAMLRDWENLRVATSFGTMPAAMAIGRFGLKTVMNLTRLGLEKFGGEGLGYRFRRSIDRALGR